MVLEFVCGAGSTRNEFGPDEISAYPSNNRQSLSHPARKSETTVFLYALLAKGHNNSGMEFLNDQQKYS